MSASTDRERLLTQEEKLEDFRECLKNSRKALALLGAGLSAASGLPTFRGAGGLWRTYEATDLATPEAFEADPGMVWEFYSYRRHMSLMANPNPGHYALAELAGIHPDFITLSQNVDGLSPRANHPSSKIHYLHGNLFAIKCSNPPCTYHDPHNTLSPLTPSLASALTTGPTQPTSSNSTETTLPHQSSTTSKIPLSSLPHCPKCNSLLRPGVVWFGESLPSEVLRSVDNWINEAENIDLIMVVGTSSTVWPAAGYVEIARSKGARVAVVNLEPDELQRRQVRKGDWLFEGDSAVLLPEMVKGVVGELKTESSS